MAILDAVDYHILLVRAGRSQGGTAKQHHLTSDADRPALFARRRGDRRDGAIAPVDEAPLDSRFFQRVCGALYGISLAGCSQVKFHGGRQEPHRAALRVKLDAAPARFTHDLCDLNFVWRGRRLSEDPPASK